MIPEFSKVKGIHPGAILKRELKIRGIKGADLARLINEHKQTISAIIHGRRGINTVLSIKLAQQFAVEADYFMHLQASYDIKREIDKQNKSIRTPNLQKFRKILFWDTEFDKLNWDKQKSAIIRRIFERGNETEIKEIISFYGNETVKKTIQRSTNEFLPSFKRNVKKFLS